MSRSYSYDLHIHSALSPCAEDDMTPNNIVNMAQLNGLDIIAVCDHNTSLNARAACEVGAEAGLIVIPGMELTTSEEIHVVCLFPTPEDAESFSAEVRATLPPIANKPDIFGRQLILDKNDEPAGEETAFLAGASGIGIYDVPPLVQTHGGAAMLAHIDRHANGVLAILGDIDPGMGFYLAEVSKNASAGDYKARFPYLHFMSDSDAHWLGAIAEPGDENKITGSFESAKDIVGALREIGKK